MPRSNRKPKKRLPNPGSDKAIKIGCTCPVLDNNHGQGYMGIKDIFCIREDCPVHGKSSDKSPKGWLKEEVELAKREWAQLPKWARSKRIE